MISLSMNIFFHYTCAFGSGSYVQAPTHVDLVYLALLFVHILYIYHLCIEIVNCSCLVHLVDIVLISYLSISLNFLIIILPTLVMYIG